MHTNSIKRNEQSSSSSNVFVQAALSIGAVNDPLEKEADAMADKVMRMPENGLIQRKCSSCEEEDKVQRKPLASFIQKKGSQGGMLASESVSNKINSSKGKGSGLPKSTKSFMGNRFGTDFSKVNIHTGGEAVQMNRELSAKAFTVGSDIYFNKGQYNPGSSVGKRLLAHELTHVLQQNSAGERTTKQSKFADSHPDIASVDLAPNTTLRRTCADGKCEDCAGGHRDFWITAFFRRRATRRTMNNLRQQINGAKAILKNCCINLKFDFNWTLLRGPAVFPAPTARPAGDPLGSLDYSTDSETLGEGATFSGARGVPMLVVDDVPGSGGGVTMLPGLDAEYTGRNYFAIAVNQPAPNPNCNHIAHELWHMTGAARHDPAEGAITACTSNTVSLTLLQCVTQHGCTAGGFPGTE